MKRLVYLIAATMLLTGCSTGDEYGPMDENILGNYDNAYGLSMGDEFNGEFAINWLVDNQVVDTTRLQVARGATVLSMPLDWFHQQIFKQKGTSSIEMREDDISKMWGLGLRLTGYSENNIYFSITNTTYTQRVFLDNHPYDYYVYFSTEKSTAVYSKQWDSWSASIPIDSIQICDETVRENHRPKIVDVISFTPARNLAFTSTKRTKNWNIGN